LTCWHLLGILQMSLTLTPEQALASIRAAGFVTFEDDEPYDLNIFGVRSASKVPNIFNDTLGCVYRCDALHWHCETWPATTDPGLYWLEHPSNVNGTAILCAPQQSRGVYALDLHAGKYLALCQRNGPVDVWRDDDRDALPEASSAVYSGYFGINIHRAGADSTLVGKWSAGCQVFKQSADFDRLMWLAQQQQKYHPTWQSYTYTLLMESQVKK